MITLTAYWMGRDEKYAQDCTAEIRANADITVEKVNALLALADRDGIELTGEVASGWRPLEVNESTSHAAEHSRHLTAQACDIRDNENRDLARWCCQNVEALEMIGLWMERFEWTPTWCHFQTVPPASGRRFFIPSAAPELIAALPEQAAIA